MHNKYLIHITGIKGQGQLLGPALGATQMLGKNGLAWADYSVKLVGLCYPEYFGIAPMES